MKEIISQVAQQQNWDVKKVSAVPGGDINQAFAVETSRGRYFIKLNDRYRYPNMFVAEAAGLRALQTHFPLKVPAVVSNGETGNQQYLVMEWLHPAVHTLTTWTAFGQALAQLHRKSHDAFGWQEANYLGSVLQQNDWCDHWPTFYADHRILPLVKSLQERGLLTQKDVQNAERFCRDMGNRMPDEPPAFLHGDLWSGNATCVAVDGQFTTAIYDPAVYYGHREIDIALTRLFGGFPQSFYDAYHEAYPLVHGWQQRQPLFQLCHLLLHAVLFGGSYVSRCKEIMDNC